MTTFVAGPANALERHRTAVRRSLGWAQESADRGDYADALGWIRVLEAIGEQLPPGYEGKCRAWGDQLVANRNNRERRDGGVAAVGNEHGRARASRRTVSRP